MIRLKLCLWFCVLALTGCVIEAVTPVPTASEFVSPILATEPTDMPAPQATLRQLTRGGCCVQPFFSPDSSKVLFIDKPSAEAPVGVYGLDLPTFESPATNQPQLVYETIGFRSADHRLVALPDVDDGRLMRFFDEATGQTWTVNTLGNWPIFSADGEQILWNATEQRGPYDERPTDVWLANVDGTEARRLLTIYGGSADGWFPDGERILLTGREARIGEEETMAVLSLSDGSTVELAREERLSSGSISPGGTWVVYLTTFTGEAERDGLWAVRADVSARQKLPFFGPHRWLDDNQLIFIPTRSSPDEGFALWKMILESGQTVRLTDPEAIPLRIEGGDWELSPDGRHVVFVSAVDQNLWLITLP